MVRRGYVSTIATVRAVVPERSKPGTECEQHRGSAVRQRSLDPASPPYGGLAFIPEAYGKTRFLADAGKVLRFVTYRYDY